MSKRLADGKFKPGTSGNPAGRPKQASTELREALRKHGADVAQKVIEAALGGDMTAAKIVIDRLVPPLKPSAQAVQIDIDANAGLAEVARAFIGAAASGRVPADIAAQMISALGAAAKVVELDELERRIEALEASDHAKTQ